MKAISIHPPRLEQVGNNARVSCVVDEAGEEKVVTFDVDSAWGEFLVTENVNAYLIALLPYAMRNSADIRLLAPVSADLLHSIEEFLVPHLAKYDDRLHPTKIHAEALQHGALDNAGAVGTGMSMGVDSFFTVSKYLAPKYRDFKLTHPFVEQVGDLVEDRLSTRHKRNVNERTIDEVADALNLPVVYAYSNVRQLFRMRHYYTHTYTSMFFVHMLNKLFDTYFYSSTVDFGSFSLADSSRHDASHHELLSLQALSTRSLTLLSGGAASSRIEKTQALRDFQPARDYLRVCLFEEFNCMTCWKCRRTLLTMDMQDTLADFGKVMDVERYRENREHYLAWLVKAFRESPDGVSIRELHTFFTQEHPEAMRRIEALYAEVRAARFQPMKRPRRFTVAHDVRKVNPFEPEQLFGAGRAAGKTIEAGATIFFDEIVTVMGRKYLRTRRDSHLKADLAIAMDALTETRNTKGRARKSASAAVHG